MVPMQRILEPLVGLKPSVSRKSTFTLPLLVCLCACLLTRDIKCANNCIDDASSLVWIYDLSFAALFIQAFAEAIRCPIEEVHILANSLISKNATVVLIL